MKIVITLISLIVFLNISFSQEKKSVDKNFAMNIIYLEGGAFVPLDKSSSPVYYSLNYERILSDVISIRIGYGESSYSENSSNLSNAINKDVDVKNQGLILMLNAFSKRNNKVSLGLGVNLFQKSSNNKPEADLKLAPSFILSYRHQPKITNLYLSAGIGYLMRAISIDFGLGFVF